MHEYAPNKALAECDQTSETLPQPEHGQGVNCRHDSQWRGRHQYIRVRTLHELWLKENLINVALGYLPHDWKYVAWVDADVLFARPNWVSETLHALQHYKIVQMFSHYQDLGPNYEVLGPPSPGVTAFYNEHGDIPRNWYGYPYPYGRKPGRGAPGLCWAARRDALEADTGVGGLLDVNIVGVGDWYMAHGLIGKMARCIFPGITQGYKRHLLEWERRALARIRKNIGTVEGLALHFFHGRKVQRGYQTRMDILRRNKLNPDLDLARDHQGMLQLIDRATSGRFSCAMTSGGLRGAGMKTALMLNQYAVGILATQPTVDADPAHAFMKIDVVRVKGKETPVAIYEPLGPKDGLADAVRRDTVDFEAAFAAYQKQHWDAAEAALRTLNARSPRALYDIYLERIAHFRTEPPPADWDGVFVYTTK